MNHSAKTTGQHSAMLAAFELLALRVPVQVHVPGRRDAVEVPPGDRGLGRLMRLFQGFPGSGVSALISDRPEDAVVSGGQRPDALAWKLRRTTPDTPLYRVLKPLHAAGYRPHLDGGRWRARCPLGDHGYPALVITEKPDRVLLKCEKACLTPEVVEELGLRMADLFVRRAS